MHASARTDVHDCTHACKQDTLTHALTHAGIRRALAQAPPCPAQAVQLPVVHCRYTRNGSAPVRPDVGVAAERSSRGLFFLACLLRPQDTVRSYPRKSITRSRASELRLSRPAAPVNCRRHIRQTYEHPPTAEALRPMSAGGGRALKRHRAPQPRKRYRDTVK